MFGTEESRIVPRKDNNMTIAKHKTVHPAITRIMNKVIQNVIASNTTKQMQYTPSILGNTRITQTPCFVVFDTETTGLDASALVVQIACILCDELAQPLFCYESIWRLPAGVRMSRASIKVHGITYKRIAEDGQNTYAELIKLNQFHRWTTSHHKVPWVAHNVQFDRRMILQTARRHNVEIPSFASDRNMFCTLTESAKMLERHHMNGFKKTRLKNMELFHYLHNNESPRFEFKLHDAVGDCRITAENYVAGKQRWHW
jgi:DNA polymerase III epsilon subunit-like protein